MRNPCDSFKTVTGIHNLDRDFLLGSVLKGFVLDEHQCGELDTTAAYLVTWSLVTSAGPPGLDECDFLSVYADVGKEFVAQFDCAVFPVDEVILLVDYSMGSHCKACHVTACPTDIVDIVEPD